MTTICPNGGLPGPLSCPVSRCPCCATPRHMNLAEWMLANLPPEVIEDNTSRKIAELINSRLAIAFDEGYDLGNFDGQCTSWTYPEDRPYRGGVA